MVEYAATATHVSTALFQFIFPFTYKAKDELQLRMSLENRQFTSFQLNHRNQEADYYGMYQVNHDDLEAFFLPLTNKLFFPSSQQAKGYQRFSKKLQDRRSFPINNTDIDFQIHSVDLFLCPYEIGFITIRTEVCHLPLTDAKHFANQIRTSPTFLKGLVIELLGLDDFLNGGIAAGFDSKIYLLSLISVNNDRKTQYHFSDYELTCISSQEADILAGSFYGQLYYSLIANLFHRLFFLKFLQDYSCINIVDDKKAIKHLIYMLNSFTSNYFFVTLPRDSDGEKYFNQFKSAFRIDYLHQCAKEVLTTLFHYEQNSATKKDSLLLLVLTLYTVICGIFSMNLFTHDLEGNIHWGQLKSYNPFEYFAVFIVFSGMIVVGFLLISSLIQGWQDKRIQKMWVEKSLLSAKKK